MTPIKALFFDLDGTLLDGSGNREAIQRTCVEIAAVRPELEAARLFEANGEVWQGYWPEVEDKWTLGVLGGAALSLEAWRRTLHACGCDDESLVRSARDLHWRHGRNMLRLFDDAREVFSLLETGMSFALVTNGAADTQRDALDTLGIERQFSAIVISGEVGVAKPDASVFRLAMHQLGAEPEQVWHVGDSLRSDVAGAKAAGVTAVWLNRGGLSRKAGDPKPDHEIRSLRELPALLAARVDRP